MPATFNRRTATKVKDGRVQRKNRHRPTGHEGYVLDRESPGRGFRHVVSKRDVQDFIDLIPDWHRYSAKLRRIVLCAPGDFDGMYDFYHHDETGVIHLSAWCDDLWFDLTEKFFETHQPILDRLGVSYDRHKDTVTCRFTEAQARAYMLLHVFMHELGHQYDRSNQKHFGAGKGEDSAERFANSRFDQLLPAYIRTFGHPARSSWRL